VFVHPAGVALLIATAAMLLFSSHAFAQSNQPYDIVKTKSNESFSITYRSANADKNAPFVYKYDTPKGNDWIMGIENSLSYYARNDTKTVVVLRDLSSADKFIEVQMYGGEARKYSVFVSTTEDGLTNPYLSEEQGWFTDQPIGVAYASNDGLTVTDGKRTVVDRLPIGIFNVGQIEVYGKENPSGQDSANAGNMNISIIYGSAANSPTYIVPALVTGGVGVLVGVLLIKKKRR
jgi:hypothetical protein